MASIRSGSFDGEHPLECDQTPFGRFCVDLDLVDKMSIAEVFQCPAQMRQVDPVHRRAHAHHGAEEMDFLFRMLGLEAIHEVQFGADRPLGSWGAVADRIDDFACAAGDIGEVVDFAWALGVHEDLDPRVLFAEAVDVFGAEHLMNTAVTFPQHNAAVLQFGFCVSTQFERVRIPHRHFSVLDAHGQRRIATVVLIRKKQDAITSLEGPSNHGSRIAARANDSAVSTAERFQACGTVDIGHWDHAARVDDFAHVGPGGFDLVNRRHIRHGASGGHVGKQHRDSTPVASLEFFRSIGQNVRGFRHEVNTAKDDRLAIHAF